MTIDKLLQHSLVISIDPIQLEYFYKCFEYMFPNQPRPLHVPGFCGTFNKVIDKISHDNTNVLNCLLSHIQCINFAKIMNWDQVMVFEDDGVFNFKQFTIQNLQNTLDVIPPDATGFTLGHVFSAPKIEINKRFFKGQNDGSHAYVVFKDGYDEIINKASNDTKHVDHMWDNIPTFYHSYSHLFIQSRIGDLSHSICRITGQDFSDIIK